MNRSILLDRISVYLFGIVLAGITFHGAGRLLTGKKKPENESFTLKYPGWLRTWHWINTKLILLLLISGISLHFVGSNVPLIPFKTARLIHNYSGILLSVSYLIFLTGNAISGNWKYYSPGPKGFLSGVLKQSKYYLFGIFRGERNPYPHNNEQKFNPQQRICYFVILYILTPISIISGLFFLFPGFITKTFIGYNGIFSLALIHLASTYIISLFMLVHIYLAVTGISGYAYCKAMFNIKQ
jgi:thiosulfate reductase cytochrome b subunit